METVSAISKQNAREGFDKPVEITHDTQSERPVDLPATKFWRRKGRKRSDDTERRLAQASAEASS